MITRISLNIKQVCVTFTLKNKALIQTINKLTTVVRWLQEYTWISNKLATLFWEKS